MFVKSLRLLLLPALLIAGPMIFAQESYSYRDPGDKFRSAITLFENEKYAAAATLFDQLSESNELPATMRSEVTLYRALCAAELDNPNAAYLVEAFIRENPQHAQSKQAYFYLGRLSFDAGRYRQALDAFRNVSPSDLDRKYRPEYYFKTGLSYLETNNPSKAKTYLERSKGSSSEYADESAYYYAHILYLEGDYEKALNEFSKLRNNRMYAKVIPYYILQIHYYTKNYEAIRTEGPALLEDAGYQRRDEVARIVADAFYRAENYQKASEYYSIFERSSRSSLTREDQYQVGYTYFKTGSFENAITFFQRAIGQKDVLSQNAYYYLGICYLKTAEKQYASNAFLSSYKLGIDPEITEESLFNYVKLSLETTSNTYNEALNLLEGYIENAPASADREEAYSYLVQLYLNSRNYKQALESIEKIGKMNTQTLEAYQQITYYRGLELLQMNEEEAAINLLKKTTEFDYNKKIRDEATFWIGEAFYRQGNYWGAVKYYSDFLKTNTARNSGLKGRAYYGLAYAQFNRKEYNQAISNFNNFLKNAGGENSKYLEDALLRLADAYFINKRYNEAIEYYDKAIVLKQQYTDYALFQKASSEGALGKFDRKVQALKNIRDYHPSSSYRDDALYEIATTYLIMNNERQALNYFDELVSAYPKSSMTVKALMRSGLIYYNNNQYQPAMTALKKVIEEYPGTPESKEALNSLRNIYVDMNRVDEYYAYARNFSFANVSRSEQDSVMYMTGENKYMEGNCEAAVTAFNGYLAEFPQGFYSVPAHYYRAECLFGAEQFSEALDDYLFVTGKPFSRFTEVSLVKAASIEWKAGNKSSALQLFKQLEEVAEYPQNRITALAGQMRVEFSDENYDAAIRAANKLLSAEQVTEEFIAEAHLTLARSYFELERADEALREYGILGNLVQNEWAAEAKYFVAYLNFAGQNFDQAEELIFELAENFAAYDYWVARGFILLADIYVEKDNVFQARQTLQSIIENYKGPELGEVAKRKLEELGPEDILENQTGTQSQ